MEPHALLEAQPGTRHPWVLQTGSQPSRGCSSPRGTRRARSPAPSPSEGSCSPSFPLPSSPSELQPHRNTRLRSINSRVACQVHSLTSRIAHAKPQVFYETFPVMKTFLWGFFFSFPSSSPLLLLLLLPGGWCPSQKNERTVQGEPSTGHVVRSVMPARGVPASCHAAPAWTPWGGGSCSTQPSGPTQKQGFKPFGCFAKKSAKPSDSHGREFAGKRPRATDVETGLVLGSLAW